MEFILPLHIHFVDYQKAFDSINHNSMWEILRCYGLSDRLIKVVNRICIKTLYAPSISVVLSQTGSKLLLVLEKAVCYHYYYLQLSLTGL